MLINSILAPATPNQGLQSNSALGADTPSASPFAELLQGMGKNMKPVADGLAEVQEIDPELIEVLVDNQSIMTDTSTSMANIEASDTQGLPVLAAIPVEGKASSVLHAELAHAPQNDDVLLKQAQQTLADTSKEAQPQRATVALSPLSQSILQSINYMSNINGKGTAQAQDSKASEGPATALPLAGRSEQIASQALVAEQVNLSDQKPSALSQSAESVLAAQRQPEDKGASVPTKPVLTVQSVSLDPTMPAQSPDGSRIITGSGTLATTQANQLSSPVATEQWGKELGRQLIQMSRSGNQQMELRLNPVELGPLAISLRMSDNNSQAQAQFLSHNPLVRQALEVALPQLREALSEQGITLSQSDVSDKGSEAFARSQGGQQQGNATSSRQGPEEIEVAQVDEAVNPLHDGLISTYA